MENERKDRAYGLEEKIMLIPLAISVCLTMAGLVCKAAGKAEATVIANQLSYYSYTWLCCIGFGASVRTGKHLKIDIFGDKMPMKLQKFWKIVNEVLGFAIIVGMFIGSFLITKNAILTGQMDAKVPQLPLILVYTAPVAGFGIGLLRSIQKLLKKG